MTDATTAMSGTTHAPDTHALTQTAVATPSTQRSLTQLSPPPSLSNPETVRQFSSLRSDQFSQDVVLNIEAQETVASATFYQLEQISIGELNITHDEFVRMWKTLIFKRSLDLFEQEKNRRHARHIRFGTDVVIPRPLADLLTALGKYQSSWNGIIYHVVPPVIDDANIPDWVNVDHNLMARFQRFMNRLDSLYQMSELPRRTDFLGTPLMFVGVNDTNNNTMRAVKAASAEVRMTDAYQAFVHDTLFDPPLVAYNDCHLDLTQPMFRSTVVTAYVGSYTKTTNA